MAWRLIARCSHLAPFARTSRHSPDLAQNPARTAQDAPQSISPAGLLHRSSLQVDAPCEPFIRSSGLYANCNCATKIVMRHKSSVCNGLAWVWVILAHAPPAKIVTRGTVEHSERAAKPAGLLANLRVWRIGTVAAISVAAHRSRVSAALEMAERSLTER